MAKLFSAAVALALCLSPLSARAGGLFEGSVGSGLRWDPKPTERIPTNVMLTAGYSFPVVKLELGALAREANGKATIEPAGGTDTGYVYMIRPLRGGAILIGDHVYGHGEPGWVCQDFKTGAEVWNYRGFGKGAVGYADGMLYCLEEGSGNVALVEASPKAWTEHGRFKLDPQTKIRNPQGRIWTHPVISNGKLYLRDQDLIYCYDVKK